MNLRRLTLLLFAVVLLGATFGCGDKDPQSRQALSGRVTMNGDVLDAGIVEFSPQGQGSISSGALIKNGQYAIESSKGLPPGKYLVRLYAAARSSSSEQAPPGPPGPPGPPPARSSARPVKGQIPPQYNVRSTLVVEVVVDGENVFDFDVRAN